MSCHYKHWKNLASLWHEASPSGPVHLGSDIIGTVGTGIILILVLLTLMSPFNPMQRLIWLWYEWFQRCLPRQLGSRPR